MTKLPKNDILNKSGEGEINNMCKNSDKMDKVMSGAFDRYFSVQTSGVTNMFYMSLVCNLASITEEQYKFIINNYNVLFDIKFPNFGKKDK